MATDEERLVIALEARVRDFERGMQRAQRSGGKSFDAIEKRAKLSGDRLEKTMAGAATRIGGVFKNFGIGLVGGLAAGGIGGLVAGLGNVANSIATIGDKAKQAGLDVKTFQELAFVAQQNRIEVDSLTAGIREMQIRLNEFVTSGGKSGAAAESLNGLGYTVQEIGTKLRRPNELFAELIGKVQSLDRASQLRIFDDIFGGDGERFVRLIEQGADGIRDTIREANELGVILEDEIIAQAEEVDRKFRAITVTVGTSLKRAIVEAVSALSTFIDTFNGIEARQTETLERQLDLHQKQLTAAQEGKERVPGFMAAPFDKQIATSQAEVDRLRQVLRDRALDAIRPQLESMGEGGVAPKGDRPGYVRPASGGARSSSRSSGADAALRERQAVAELIAELEEELRLIGATDAQRRAAEASRRAGAAATDQERARIVALNEAIYQEGEALQSANDKARALADAGRDFVGGFVQDIRSGVAPLQALGNAIGRLADRMFDELLTAIFSVQDATAGGGGIAGGVIGWISKLFGFSTGGMVKADAWKGLRLAGGGHVRGAGTSTSDSIPAMLSDGEFIVNAAATGKHRALLEAVNDNRLPGFASGGLVGGGSPIVAGNDNRSPVNVTTNVTVNANGGRPEDNADLSKQIARQVENSVRGIVADEARKQSRPGNFFNRRGG